MFSGFTNLPTPTTSRVYVNLLELKGFNHFWLVVLTCFTVTILKKYDSMGRNDIPYMKWKIKKCLKPPSRFDMNLRPGVDDES